MAERRRELPNWARGIVDWATAHKGQAVAIAGGLLLVMFFMLRGGESPEPGVQEDQASDEERVFEATGLPEDVQALRTLGELQRSIEALNLRLESQVEQDGLLEREIERVKSGVDEFRRRTVAELGERFELTVEERLEGMIDAILGEHLEQVLDIVQTVREEEARERQAAGAFASVQPLQLLRPGDVPGGPGPESGTPPPAPPAAPAAPDVEANFVRLPAGSVVGGRILTGAFATPVQGDALPVLIGFDTDFRGPNNTEIPLSGCLVIGAATADVGSVRARVQARHMACVLPNGQTFESPFNGYLTGKDSVLGVPGRFEMRNGRWMANLLTSMGVSASAVFADYKIAEALGTGTFFSGLPSVSETVALPLQEFFLSRAEEILPMVWIDAGVDVNLVALEGVTITGLTPTLASTLTFGESFE